MLSQHGLKADGGVWSGGKKEKNQCLNKQISFYITKSYQPKWQNIFPQVSPDIINYTEMFYDQLGKSNEYQVFLEVNSVVSAMNEHIQCVLWDYFMGPVTK